MPVGLAPRGYCATLAKETGMNIYSPKKEHWCQTEEMIPLKSIVVNQRDRFRVYLQE